MITIKFRSGKEKSFKVVTTELRDGTLILHTKYRSKLRRVPTFPVEKIEWAHLSNGSVIIGEADLKSGAVEGLQEASIGRTVNG